MADTLEDIFGSEEKPQAQPSEPSKEDEQKKQEEELRKKQEQLNNLNKAILEANETLKKVRGSAKKPVQEEEEEVPKIDMNDPGSKAWDKHIREQVNPLQSELEKEKQEIRSFAFKRFLQDKPDLVNNPEGFKKVVETYDKIKTASERTVEGVLLDLEKAYAAENYEQILGGIDQGTLSRAKAEESFSDIAISRGSTAYPTQRTKNPKLTEDETREVIRMYGSVEEYFKYKKARDEKYG